MQVVDPLLVKESVLLLETDVLSLSGSFEAAGKGTRLHDLELGAVHSLHNSGSFILLAIAKTTQVKALRILASQCGIHPTQLNELLGFLNSIGALAVERRLLAHRLRAFAVRTQHMVYGGRYANQVWRRSATAHTLMPAVWRVCGPVNGAGLVATTLLVASGIVSLSTAGVGLIFGISIFTSSIYFHELAHWLVIRRAGTRAILLQHGLRLGIVHRELEPLSEIFSAVAGPVAGLSWAVAGAFGAMAAGYTELAILGYVIAAFHLASFTPGYGDGRSLTKATQQLLKRTTYGA